MSEQHIPEPIELVVLTVPVVFEDSDKDDAYDKVDRHLRNSLDDTDYAEYSEALDTVADCSGLTNQRDELLAALENLTKQRDVAAAKCDEYFTQAKEFEQQRDELMAACEKTISENGHLADGDVCTLIDFKRAIARVKGQQ